jgi:molybdenum cofactor cytidylyltransferase
MSEIWAIILAAGESKRMGSPKMLLPYKRRTIVEHVIKNILKSKVDNTMVVLGSFRREILNVIREHPVKHCYNKDYKQGMLSSVKCGFRFLPERFGAALVFLGDQPMIEPEIIDQVIEAYRSGRKGIVVPVCDNKRGHPLLIDSRYRDDIIMLRSDEGLRALSHKFSDDVLEIEVTTSDILKDIDTREDYLTELKQIH